MTATTPTTLAAPQVRELLDGNPRVRLIDVRTPGEFAAAHIPGSANVPLDVLRQRRAEITAAHADPVVLVCASGSRAQQAHSVLAPAMRGPLSVLDGGVTAWQRHGETVNQGSGTWAMERQVRLAAGLLVLTGVLGSTRYAPLKWLSGFVGGGLTFAALTDTCAMARALACLPHNRRATDAGARRTSPTDLTVLTDEEASAPTSPAEYGSLRG